MILIYAAVLPYMYVCINHRVYHQGVNDDHHQGVNDDPHQGGGAPPAGRRVHTFQGSLLTLSDKKCCQRGGTASRDDACFSDLILFFTHCANI